MSGTTYSWVKGLTVRNNKIVSGYYDAEKTRAADDDDNLCWAGVAGNMLAWWQNYYGITADLSYSVLSNEDDIFDLIEANWENKGGWSREACRWWLAGGTSFTNFNGMNPGGFFSQFYSSSSVRKACYNVSVKGMTAAEIGNGLSSLINAGGIAELSITTYKNGVFANTGHAITLWGIEQDSTGCLRSIHITDSDDYRHQVVTLNVRYDANLGYYHLTDYSSGNYYLRDYDVLKAAGQEGFLKPIPQSLQARQQGKTAVFSWSAGSKAGVTYELAYQLVGGSEFIFESCRQESLSLTLSASGTYSWYVRSSVGTASTSDWIWGGNFVFDITASVLSFNGASLKKSGKGKTTATFTWSVDETSTYTLVLDGRQVYSGSGKGASRRFSLADGVHNYTLTATDAAGNNSSQSGSFRCDTVAPPAPTGLKVELREGGAKATLTWNTVSDVSGVTYEFELKKASASRYTRYECSPGVSYMTLGGVTTRYWRVRAVDGLGNASAWVYGEAFINKMPSAASLSVASAASEVGEELPAEGPEGSEEEPLASPESALTWVSSVEATYASPAGVVLPSLSEAGTEELSVGSYSASVNPIDNELAQSADPTGKSLGVGVGCGAAVSSCLESDSLCEESKRAHLTVSP